MNGTPTLRIPGTIIAFLLLFIVIGSRAQSFQQSDLDMLVGHTYQYYQLLPEDMGTVPLDTTLGNEYWDYGQADWSNSFLIGSFVAIDPSDAPAIAYFPNATRVVRENWNEPADENHTDMFYAVSDSGIEFLGTSDEPAWQTRSGYSDPITENHYPMQYGGSFTDRFCGGIRLYLGDPNAFSPVCGSKTITYASIGTLDLPYGQFADTRLLRKDYASWDSIAPMDTVRGTILEWYIPQLGVPVLKSYVERNDQGQLVATVGYVMNPDMLLDLSVHGPSPVDFMLQQNPVSDLLQVRRTVQEAAELTVLTSDGRRMLSRQVGAHCQEVSFDVSALPAGLYTIEVRSSTGRSARRFVKQ